MADHIGNSFPRLPGVAGRSREPMTGRMKVDKAATLAGALIIHPQPLTKAGETLAEGVGGIAFIGQLMKEPSLAFLPGSAALHKVNQIGMHRDRTGGGLGLALLNVEHQPCTIRPLSDFLNPNGHDFGTARPGQLRDAQSIPNGGDMFRARPVRDGSRERSAWGLCNTKDGSNLNAETGSTLNDH